LKASRNRAHRKPLSVQILLLFFLGGQVSNYSALNLIRKPQEIPGKWSAAINTAAASHRRKIRLRAIAVLNTCIYDGWSAYDQKAVGTELAGALRRPPPDHTIENKQRAISYAAYRALADLYPANIESQYKPLMKQLGYEPNNSTDIETPAGIGNVACNAVLELRHHDKSNQLGDLAQGPYSDWTRFTPSNHPLPIPVRGPIPPPGTVLDPSHWQPLSYVDSHGNFAMQMFTTAHWCFVTPFALPVPDAHAQQPPQECPLPGELQRILAPGPPKFGDPEYQAQAKELLDFSANLTDRQKMIAEYWTGDDESAATLIHWFQFAEVVSERDHHTLDDDVKMYFALSNALLDTEIAASAAKRNYNSVRPITAIKFLYNGKQIPSRSFALSPGSGNTQIDGSQWMPYRSISDPTPPSPDFVAEESALSAAAARILALFTGSDRFDYSVTLEKGSSKIEPGLTPREPVVLQWHTFTEAADQAGMATRYAGISFRSSDLKGRALGRAVADLAWARANSYFNGTAPPQHFPPSVSVSNRASQDR
jgi:hypothetical protein